MQVVGVSHVIGSHEVFGRTSNYLEQTIRYFSRQPIEGRTIAIEIDIPIRNLLEINDRIQKKDPQFVDYRGARLIQYWAELARYLQERGAIVVPVEDYFLRVRHGEIKRAIRLDKLLELKEDLPRLEKQDQSLGFRRTLRLVKNASDNKADWLVTGYGHAREIQLVLGPIAHVTQLVSRNHLREYDTLYRKRFTDRFTAAARKKKYFAAILTPAKKQRSRRK